MSREELINLVQIYFNGVDSKNINQIFSTLSKECKFSVETHEVVLVGQERIRGMFERLWSNHAAVQHDKFHYVVDMESGNIATQFRVINTHENGEKVYKSNCNFFTVREALFETVAVYMAGENTLDQVD